jgi:predicted ABC-type ATPase
MAEMKEIGPHVVILAGPNGAGKSTAAPSLLRGTLRVREFVNADVIAQGISGFEPDAAAIQAGRVMVSRLKSLAKSRVDFAFETTLASRAFAPWIRDLLSSGYAFSLVFLWLPSVEAAIARVRERVQVGGHAVPEETIRRRYAAGLRNFFQIYQPLATRWRFYDNGGRQGPRVLAEGQASAVSRISDPRLWKEIEVGYGHGSRP